MAIIHDGYDNNEGGSHSEILDRLALLELQMDEFGLEMESIQLEMLLQNKRMENMSDVQKTLERRRACWQQSLMFKDQRIHSEGIWRGSVTHAFAAITKDLVVDDHSYIGTTYDPERRLKEHVRKTIFSNDIKTLDKSAYQKNFRMDILYHTTCSGKAAEMESRLLWKYPLTRNIMSHANGVAYGKPSYFVYLLRHLRVL